MYEYSFHSVSLGGGCLGQKITVTYPDNYKFYLNLIPQYFLVFKIQHDFSKSKKGVIIGRSKKTDNLIHNCCSGKKLEKI